MGNLEGSQLADLPGSLMALPPLALPVHEAPGRELVKMAAVVYNQ